MIKYVQSFKTFPAFILFFILKIAQHMEPRQSHSLCEDLIFINVQL